jgi:hypothetical protein
VDNGFSLSNRSSSPNSTRWHRPAPPGRPTCASTPSTALRRT